MAETSSGGRRARGTVTVLVADPHPRLRAALAAALTKQPEVAVVGSAGRLEDAVAAMRRLRPDVVLLDLAVLADRGIDGLGELASVRRSTALLVMGVVEDAAFTRGVLRAGAAARVMKHAPAAELAAAVRSAAGRTRRLRAVPSDEQ